MDTDEKNVLFVSIRVHSWLITLAHEHASAARLRRHRPAKDEKEDVAHRSLSAQFEGRKIFKEYAALTAGVLDRDSDYIEGRIGHHPHDRVKMTVTDDDEEGKEACSFYEVVERFRGYTFCRISPRTGRTHQIRVHLASVGCPVLQGYLFSKALPAGEVVRLLRSAHIERRHALALAS